MKKYSLITWCRTPKIAGTRAISPLTYKYILNNLGTLELTEEIKKIAECLAYVLTYYKDEEEFHFIVREQTSPLQEETIKGQWGGDYDIPFTKPEYKQMQEIKIILEEKDES